MKSACSFVTLALLGGAMITSGASAAVTITQSAGPAPTYASSLTFDEPGAPTGANLPSNSWAGFGVPSIVSGEGSNFVGDVSGSPGLEWMTNTSNVYFGPFGVFMQFGQDLSSVSLQAWDNSGPPTFFGGGMGIVLINDGDENNPVAFEVFTPAWGGLGDTWFNITTTAGEVFDEVRVLGFGFGPQTIVDNVSWQPVPAPGALALMGLAGIVGGRRRRA